VATKFCFKLGLNPISWALVNSVKHKALNVNRTAKTQILWLGSKHLVSDIAVMHVPVLASSVSA